MTETAVNDTAVTEILTRLVRLVAEHGLSELTVEEDGLLVSIKGLADAAPSGPVAVQMHPHLLPPAHAPAFSQTAVLAATPAAPARPAVPPARPAGRVALESPMVGVYYRSPSPDDPPFVNVGDVIRIGQTVGLIEAMKVYSELPSEVAGRVVELVAESGKLVKQGQPLLYVEPV